MVTHKLLRQSMLFRTDLRIHRTVKVDINKHRVLVQPRLYHRNSIKLQRTMMQHNNNLSEPSEQYNDCKSVELTDNNINVHNHNKQLNDTIQTIQYQYLSFFYYTHFDIDQLPKLQQSLTQLFTQYQCKGRIYLATEGINAQMMVPVQYKQQWETELRQWANNALAGTKITYGQTVDVQNNTTQQQLSDSETESQSDLNTGSKPSMPIFSKLNIRLKTRLVNDGLSTQQHNQLDLHNHGISLTPEQWHNELSQSDNNNNIVIDVRNWYESEIGKFENAIPLPTNSFRDVFQAIDNVIDTTKVSRQSQQPNVYMYCTGGIRCVKVGAYLKSKNVNNVKLLDGGINSYFNYIDTMKQQGVDIQPIWRGSNFVFDKRATFIESQSNALKLDNNDIISKCQQCNSVPHDQYINCSNPSCDVLLLQCSNCATQYNQCCSMECKTAKEQNLHSTPLRYSTKKPHRYRIGSHNTTQSNNTKHTTHSIDTKQALIADELKCTTITCPHHDTYCHTISTQPANTTQAVLKQIQQYTAQHYSTQVHMLCGDTVGNLLCTLMSLNNTQHILELGTFTGYSTAYLMSVLPNTGTITTIELSEEHANVANDHLKQLHNYEQLNILRGDAALAVPYLHTLHSSNTHLELPAQFNLIHGSMDHIAAVKQYDCIFIDANKNKYQTYIEYILQYNMLSSNGIIVIDNTLLHGHTIKSHSIHSHTLHNNIYSTTEHSVDIQNKILHDTISLQETGNQAKKIVRFNKWLKQQSQLHVTVLPLRDGVTIVRHAHT